MKVKFTKEFIKKVRSTPNHWRDETFILKQQEKPIKTEDIIVKINGFLYGGEDIEIIK